MDFTSMFGGQGGSPGGSGGSGGEYGRSTAISTIYGRDNGPTADQKAGAWWLVLAGVGGALLTLVIITLIRK